MNTQFKIIWIQALLSLLIWCTGYLAMDGQVPPVDRRAVEIRNLDMAYTFTPFKSQEEWLSRARTLRQQILVSSGLWPMPKKTELNPQIFGKIERDDYSVEKVYFESYPGFYVTGNLYRPLKRSGPFPAVLCPHGHWEYGRLENQSLGSIPGRSLSLARQGYVVFTYDMVGYNDSYQVNHRLLSKPLTLWGVGSLGLHLWNSIRSVDFLESLPDVDKNRIACTGASGGGTQTFLLTAVDDRVKASAPVNMISHFMQGGDVCENAPNLRLDTNNMEIGALMAPRPMLMVSAAGDWTVDTPRIEFPAIQSVYRLLGAEDKVQTVQFFADHNYNKDSREAVYAWFGRWMLGLKDADNLKEKEFHVGFPSDLLVFFGRELPKQAKTEEQIVNYLKQESEQQLQEFKPSDASGLSRHRDVYGTAFQHALAASYPGAESIVESAKSAGGEFYISRSGVGDRVPVKIWLPKRKAVSATLIVHPEGITGVESNAGTLISALGSQNQLVLSLDTFNTGSAKAQRDMSDQFFTTYNRTDDANRVQDILTALAYLKSRTGIREVNLVGLERAGLWCLLARALVPELSATVADADGFDSSDDAQYLEKLYIPHLRRAGDFRTALMLAAPSRLLIQNTAGRFGTEWALLAYRIGQAEARLRIESGKLPLSDVSSWLSQKK